MRFAQAGKDQSDQLKAIDQGLVGNQNLTTVHRWIEPARSLEPCTHSRRSFLLQEISVMKVSANWFKPIALKQHVASTFMGGEVSGGPFSNGTCSWRLMLQQHIWIIRCTHPSMSDQRWRPGRNLALLHYGGEL